MVDTSELRAKALGIKNSKVSRFTVASLLEEAADEIDRLRSGEKSKEEILEEREHREKVAHFTGKYPDGDSYDY